MEKKQFDVVVVGGGVSGMCAALAAARHGAHTALVQDRPVLGGNASSEVRMHICGADIHANKPNLRETGIIEELLLKNRFANPQQSFNVQDYIFLDAVIGQEGLELFLNTRIIDVRTEDNKICELSAVQSATEKRFCFSADIFVDATGDGYIGFQAGADFMYGREGKDVFGEPHAPACSDRRVMGSSLMFTAKDMGRRMPFAAPSWAYRYTEEDLNFRDHREITSGYWWIEAGAEDIIGEQDKIYSELSKMLFGVWDHIKNTEGHHAENYALDWIAPFPAKRESRRLTGDYVLREQDLVSHTAFQDVVAYGGWNIDLHIPEGLNCASLPPNSYVDVEGCYGIPYRCLYSRNIGNLFLAGRAISVSHIAFASTRVMGTCAVVGQAVGAAAALCVRRRLSPRDLGERIEVLQELLMKDDCYLPGLKLITDDDLALQGELSCSGGQDTLSNVTNGILRNIGAKINCWQSDGMQKDGEWIQILWASPKKPKSVVLRFDSDLSSELTITLSDAIRSRQKPIPSSLIRRFCVEFYLQDQLSHRIEQNENQLRFCRLDCEGVVADKIVIRLLETYGDEKARVFGINVY